MTLLKTIEIQSADSPSVDAFSRQRMSLLTTLSDYKQHFDALPLLIDQVQSGTGGIVYNSGESSATLSTVSANDYAIAQTKQRSLYQSGKSSLIFQTFYNFHIQSNIEKRIGYFSSSTVAPYNANYDGIILVSNYYNGVSHDGKISVQIWRNGTQIGYVTQNNWNKDKMDGTGASKINIDWSKDQILKIDFQYLGVGRVRVGLDVNGIIYEVHEFNHTNAIQKVYMNNSAQPLRWEIRQTGAGSGTFTFICGSTNSEGSLNSIGLPGSANTGSIAIAGNSVGTTYALLGIRLKSARFAAIVDIINATILANTTDQYYTTLLLNPTVAGTFAYNAVVNYSVDIATGASTNTVTGGTLLRSLGSQNTEISKLELGGALRMGSTIAGVSDTLIVCVTPLSANINFFATINWLEF
ncbi:MAG TPA: hypothetical protein V6C58_17530 [Allocoleopsis sp.]